MSGIPIYTQSPINTATKATGVTPQTFLADGTSQRMGPQEVGATTTATPTTSYTPAQPGARPAAPTGSAQQYAPSQPTPTSTSQSQGPPPPQAGSFPTPSNRSTVPPPPKAGEKFNPPQQTAAPTYYPPQMSMPPPTAAIGSHSQPTSTTNAPSSSYPVGLPTERRSLEHPPGYHQNTYASDLNPDQRRAHEASANATSLGLPTSSQNRSSFEDEGIWNTAKNWAQQAGEKLSVAEAEVWKKINK